ncbi:ABC transporter ATP-binding protein [Brachybacterium sp. JHP9]|uniref:ABC transporter ATP-binding protein n=1 Tax=Brachybacterium equifaecis TaxID=2910770 RepID=A0ABT0QZA1_9MICO|nr:ABC transporter ATP-binding protein [Brachybacterium equifaecis]MCL6422984.1 ABC transporter ATP-binding protein [Brachybacterium equifaecis]
MTEPLNEPILRVSDLSVSFPSEAGRVNAVQNLSYEVRKGEALAIVGESGSGKSVSSLAVMGLLPSTAEITGDIEFLGYKMREMNDRQLSKLRGDKISMVFQDPLSALTPVYTIGDQVAEVITLHDPSINDAKAKARAIELLDAVGIPEPQRRANQFPHEFSGGMRQRAMIAMAIANEPELIIADEPTTALDVTIQAQVMELLKTAQEMVGAATVLITHDLGVVAGFADRVLVMEKSFLVEQGTVDDIYYRPQQAYTQKLLSAVPRVDGRESAAERVAIERGEMDRSEISAVGGARPDAVTEAVDTTAAPKILEIKDLKRIYPITKGVFFRRKIGEQPAVDGISFDIHEGECFALVGESGCGKTTTLMEIMKLAAPQSGTIKVNGKLTSDLSKAERHQLRSDIAIVFQDPMASLDPRLPIGDTLREPMQVQGYSRDKMDDRISWLLETVGLLPEHADRFPHEFSGGQRQRIGVARALACDPKLIVLDEPTSALDVTIQAGVLELLQDLKNRLGVSYLFVSHDLSVVRNISDRIAVMYKGRIVEQGRTEDVFENPQHIYTRSLLSAVPIPDPEIERKRERVIVDRDELAAQLERDRAAADSAASTPAAGSSAA